MSGRQLDRHTRPDEGAGENLRCKWEPKIIRCDNGREFIGTTLKNWLAERAVAIAHIEKGQPQQNCFVERYDGTMRDEKLANEDFDTVLEARIIVREWAFEEYNIRPSPPRAWHADTTTVRS